MNRTDGDASAEAIRVDLARLDDLPDLTALLAAIDAETPRAASAWANSLSTVLNAPPGHYWLWLARRGAQPIGYALVILIPKLDPRRGYLFVDELYVLEAFRRLGAASRLLAAASETATELDCHRVRLLVRESNSGARALYREAGFVEYPALMCELRQ
jgi:ribosomal protein S18 acetylase RimI-like enzyme